MSVRRFEGVQHAEEYKKYRPVYNKDLFTRIIDYVKSSPAVAAECPKFDGARLPLAVDIGCGSGQSVSGLVEYFDCIIGVDVSEAQIEQAISSNTYDNVQFRVSTAESLPLDNASVDLITVGMSLHWLDWPEFYREVDRVLKPGGVIAAYAHSFWLEVIEHPKSEELTNITTAMLKNEPVYSYWHERDKCIDRKYADKDMQIPYSDTTRDESLALYIDGTIESLFAYLKTRSAFNNYLRENGEAGQMFWRNAINRFCETYGTTEMSAPVRYKLDLYLLLGKKPLEV